MEQAVAEHNESGTDNWICAGFEQRINSGAGRREPASVTALRVEAFKQFSELGFPSSGNESWKYTNLIPIKEHSFSRAEVVSAGKVSSHDLASFILPTLAAPTVVFVNGVFNPALSRMGESLSTGVSVAAWSQNAGTDTTPTHLSELIEKHLGKVAQTNANPLAALNTAMFENIAVIHLAEGVRQTAPLHIIHISAGEGRAASFPRLLLVAEVQSEVSLLESFVTLHRGRGHLTVPLAEIVVGEGARVEYCKLANESENAYHLAHLRGVLGCESKLSAHIANIGGSLVRNELEPVLNGERAECALGGATVLNSVQHVDNNIIIEHASAHCQSLQRFKGIYADRSHGVFSGTIVVRQAAQKTNAYQSNDSILLSDSAASFTRPQLKIWADDVRCTHGATMGQLDEDAMFYLRSRGISADLARSMLLSAFAAEGLSAVVNESIKEHLSRHVMDKLRKVTALF